MKFLIAGLGSIGRRHFRNLIALGERDILLYRTHQATLPDDELSGFPVETDLHTALAHDPDAVIISNPTAFHLDVAIPAAQHGCHILLEKPVSHSLARVGELVQAVQQNGGKVLVGFQFRFHPGLQKLKQLLDAGSIGAPLSARAHWGEYLPDWHPWEDYKLGYAARPDLGGGVVLTLSHPLDYLRWLLGEVESIWALLSHAGLNMPVEDLAEMGLRFENGTIASLHLDYDQQPPSHTLQVIGTHGTLQWDNRDGITRLAQVLPGGTTSSWQEFTPPNDFERNTMFLDELHHFLQVLRGEVEPLCTLMDGIQALKLALAAHQSNQLQQVVLPGKF